MAQCISVHCIALFEVNIRRVNERDSKLSSPVSSSHLMARQLPSDSDRIGLDIISLSVAAPQRTGVGVVCTPSVE